jgi:hypothetical protein
VYACLQGLVAGMSASPPMVCILMCCRCCSQVAECANRKSRCLWTFKCGMSQLVLRFSRAIHATGEARQCIKFACVCILGCAQSRHVGLHVGFATLANFGDQNYRKNANVHCVWNLRKFAEICGNMRKFAEICGNAGTHANSALNSYFPQFSKIHLVSQSFSIILVAPSPKQHLPPPHFVEMQRRAVV